MKVAYRSCKIFFFSVVYLVFMHPSTIYSNDESSTDRLKETASSFLDKTKGVWGGVKDIFTGSCAKMAGCALGTAFTVGAVSSTKDCTTEQASACGDYFASIGLPGDSYIFNYLGWNDSPIPIVTTHQQIRSIMGTQFQGNLDDQALIPPFKKFSDSVFIQTGTSQNLSTNADQKAYQTHKLYLGAYAFVDPDQKKIEYPSSLSDYQQNYQSISPTLPSIVKKLQPSNTDVGSIVADIASLGLLELFRVTFSTQFLVKAATAYKILIEKGVENDDNVWIFRVYKNTEGIQGEVLWGGTTSVVGFTQDFSGVFFSNANQEDIYMQFTKDGITHVVNLEPNTFNYLQSSKKSNSIRPKESTDHVGISFFKGRPPTGHQFAYLPLMPYGLANVLDTSTGNPDDANYKPAYSIGGPKQYTYEIYTNKSGSLSLAVHSLTPGKYPVPVMTSHMQVSDAWRTDADKEFVMTSTILYGRRDINPATCNVWYKDATMWQQERETEFKKTTTEALSYSQIPINPPENVWACYQSKDTVVRKKIAPGAVESFKIIRPGFYEQDKGWLYLVSIQSNDDAKTEQFLDRISSGAIGKEARNAHIEIPGIGNQETLAAALNFMQPSTLGLIYDTNNGNDQNSTGLTGALLCIDSFVANGDGDGPFFYQVLPPFLQVSDLIAVMQLKVDEKTGQPLYDEKELAMNLVGWITDYYANKVDAVTAGITLYLQRFGNDNLFANPEEQPERRKFSTIGLQVRDSLLTGPVSIKNYPLLRYCGINYPLTTEVPTGWPDQLKT
jgi:hypothetical protein